VSKIIGVRLLPKGNLFYCDAGDVSLQEGDYVVLDSAKDLKVAKVTSLEVQIQPSELTEPIMRVLHRAEPEDLNEDRRNREEKALAKCKETAAKLGLKMKPLAARYDFETGHFTIFFRAAERIDFRELVRKLRHNLKTRVEVRQIGPRDEAKILGGIGRCGYPLCCQGFLGNFAAVSIKMAKEQGLALNPMKISGLCGRLLCCLSYESKYYAEIKRETSPSPEKTTTVNSDDKQ
jgi:cell fate regulator YaaT (PSP1 superfamily)